MNFVGSVALGVVEVVIRIAYVDVLAHLGTL
jgi:hypothetical protein